LRLAAPEYIRARRESDLLWLRRHRRSLGANRQHRRVHGARQEAAKEQEKVLRELRERKEAARAARTKQNTPRLWDKAKKFFQSIGRRANQK